MSTSKDQYLDEEHDQKSKGKRLDALAAGVAGIGIIIIMIWVAIEQIIKS